MIADYVKLSQFFIFVSFITKKAHILY